MRKLRQRGDLAVELPAMRAVGYRQILAYLAKETGYDEMREQAIVATRQYAKRQLTWLRGEQGLLNFASGTPLVADRIAECLTQWLDQPN